MNNQHSPVVSRVPFTLPKGLVDSEGNIHRHGTMRLATARDEMAIYQNPQVRNNPAYEILIRLSQVITGLGQFSTVTPQILEELPILDLVYLRDVYHHVNHDQDPRISVACPHCQSSFLLELNFVGESLATL
jgi:hypothetical protein